MNYFSSTVFLLLLIVSCEFDAVGAMQRDSTTVAGAGNVLLPKRFDQQIINDFWQSSDFSYELPPETRPNILQMIFRKFFEWLVLIFGNEGVAWLVLIVMIILGAIGLGFAIYGIFGVGKTMPVYSREDGGIDYSVKEENIHEINYTEEINLSVEQGDFRKAVRLVYLFALKLLSERNIISWFPSKTNHEYLSEVKSESFKSPFSSLIYYFEYVWYGEFEVNENLYREMQKSFSTLKNNLQQDVES